MSDTRILKTVISVKIPPQNSRQGLARLESNRREMAVKQATAAFYKVMEDYGIEGVVTYTTTYLIEISKTTVILKPRSTYLETTA